MPLAKHRPDFQELITIAALQRKSIHKRQNKHYASLRKKDNKLKYSASAEEDEDGEGRINTEDGDGEHHSDMEAKTALAKITRKDVLIDISDFIRWFLDLFVVRMVRISVVILAFLNLTYEAQTTRGDNSDFDNAVQISDTIVAVYFLLEGSLKVLAFYAHMDMHKAFDLKIDTVLCFRRLGFVDIILGILSLYFGANRTGGWFRLLRVLLISSFALDETPHLVILVSGITHGLKSIMSTCLLLFLVFMVYGGIALYFFGKNDPYHFGTIALSMWSFFELATLDNWSQVLYVNMYGCDRFPAYYTVVNSSFTGATQISRYGSTLMLPICTSPDKHPALSAVIFLSFIVICAFILVNLTIAAVTSGINVRLDRIKNEGSNVTNALSQMVAPESGTNYNSLPGEPHIADPEMLLMLLRQVWREQDEYARKQRDIKNSDKKRSYRKSMDASSLDLHKSTMSTTAMANALANSQNSSSHKLRLSSFDEEDPELAHQSDDHIGIFEWRGQSMLCRDLLAHFSYQYAMFVLIAVSAFAELVVLQRGGTHLYMRVFSLLLQLLFSADVYIQVVAVYPNFGLFFNNNWQCFDTFIVVVTWIPVFAWDQGPAVLELINILRILRLLKLLRWIHELNVILHSIASSALAIFYVYVLIFGLAYHFAVAGVFLFATNDPQHFENLAASFVTLFQVQSLDDWSEIARTNMYGCDYWGYDSGEDYYDEQCSSPHGMGWFAALYFVMYIMTSVMVLLSLFIGIIITSMELLKEGIKEENEVWEKVKLQQKKYNMRDATINNLLEIFDMIDTGMNGKLTLNELKPIFDIITISEASQFSLYMMVDTDNSGQIDFAEFLELLYLVGKAYKAQHKSKHKKHSHSNTKKKPTPLLTKALSAKGFALTMKSKLTGGSPSSSVKVTPEMKKDRDSDEKSGNSEVSASPVQDKPPAKRELPRRISLVTQEEEDFVDKLKKSYHSDDDDNDNGDDDGNGSVISEQTAGSGKHMLNKSFFQKEMLKDHTIHDGRRSSCESSVCDDAISVGTNDVPPSAEKESLNFSFFEKHQAGGGSVSPEQSRGLKNALVHCAPESKEDMMLSKQLSDTFDESKDSVKTFREHRDL
mmetsp:Transcript_4917/g.9241  ORF Transcript_4917/g.9241 Transcript_4917/m.9241 type:complete len:1103 (-) Transcript_4917:96-3404(-)